MCSASHHISCLQHPRSGRQSFLKTILFVDGSEIRRSPVEGMVVYPIFYDGFGIHPRWLGMGLLNHQQYSSDDCMFSWLKIPSERNTTSKDNVSPLEITNFTIHLHLHIRRWCDFYIAWRKRWVVAIVFKLIGCYLLQSSPSIFSSPHLYLQETSRPTFVEYYNTSFTCPGKQKVLI